MNLKLSDYIKQKLEDDPEFRNEYYRFDLKFELEMLWFRIKMWIKSFLN